MLFSSFFVLEALPSALGFQVLVVFGKLFPEFLRLSSFWAILGLLRALGSKVYATGFFWAVLGFLSAFLFCFSSILFVFFWGAIFCYFFAIFWVPRAFPDFLRLR